MDKALSIQFQASRQLLVAYALLAVICVIGVLALAMAWFYQLLLLVLLMVLIGRVVYRYVLLKAANSIIALDYRPQRALGQQWQIQRKHGTNIDVTLILQDCFVSSYLTVLNLKPVSRSTRWWPRVYTIVILPDSLNHEAYRRLRVLLRWGKHQQSEQTI